MDGAGGGATAIWPDKGAFHAVVIPNWPETFGSDVVEERRTPCSSTGGSPSIGRLGCTYQRVVSMITLTR